MVYVVLSFLFLSMLFYLAFGGADYGVGVIELFSGKKNRQRTKTTAYRVIGPVWEANHIWLIICIVILWIAFPSYYNLIVTQLHIPLTLLLVGIIGRGTAFVFRHYDAYKDGSQRLYDLIFRWSSVLSPFFIGLTAGALLSGQMIHPDEVQQSDFYTLYVQTWLNPFAVLTGVFVTALTAFIASVFLIGETQDELRMYYTGKARRATIVAVVSGVLVIGEALWSQRTVADLFLSNALAVIVFALATVLLFPLWYFIAKGKKLLPRLILGSQLFLVLIVWLGFAFPHVMLFQNGNLAILENIPPPSVFNALGWALIVASVFVLPGLYHLFKTFGLLSQQNDSAE